MDRLRAQSGLAAGLLAGSIAVFVFALTFFVSVLYIS
ncbi:hypothetical protein BH10ACT11_BH10ACT11_06950 [soil metagenome]